MKKIYSDIKVDNSELYALIINEIFKCDVIEGAAATDAKKSLQKAEKKMAAIKVKKAVPQTE